ncbi:signal peptidase II [Paracoccaceae bacterium]|jgi:signal peptidase II|nr:signal peptidase II [Paracoccaceae bacterium]|tara:strand:+ start:110 stop:580 length:471 start_codon:yes stop_codon:yes gene_type:complete
MRKFYFILIATFCVDQFSKWFVVFWLNLISLNSIDVFPPFVNFRMGWNYGVNFGLFGQQGGFKSYFLISLSIIITVLIILWIYRTKTSSFQVTFGALLCGGALANAFDRIIYNGAVADFLNMSCCGFYNPFVFNFADVFIFIGAVGLAFSPENKIE